jgi:hypothetical protein
MEVPGNSSPLRRSPENTQPDAPSVIADSRKSSASSSTTFATLLDREYLATCDEWVDDGFAETAAPHAVPRRGDDLRRLSLSQRSAHPEGARACAQRRRSAAAEAPPRILPHPGPPIGTANPSGRLPAGATSRDGAAAARPAASRRRLSIPLEPERTPLSRHPALHQHGSARCLSGPHPHLQNETPPASPALPSPPPSPPDTHRDVPPRADLNSAARSPALGAALPTHRRRGARRGWAAGPSPRLSNRHRAAGRRWAPRSWGSCGRRRRRQTSTCWAGRGTSWRSSRWTLPWRWVDGQRHPQVRRHGEMRARAPWLPFPLAFPSPAPVAPFRFPADRRPACLSAFGPFEGPGGGNPGTAGSLGCRHAQAGWPCLAIQQGACRPGRRRGGCRCGKEGTAPVLRVFMPGVCVPVRGADRRRRSGWSWAGGWGCRTEGP